LTQPLNTTFANLVTAIWGPSVDTVNVTTTAIAAFRSAGTACYLALDTSAANAFLVDNGGTLPNSNCWAASNSSSGSALNCNGCTIAGPTNVVGGDMVSNGGQLNGSPNRTYASAIADPYAGISAENPAVCPPSAGPVTGGSIGPGHYCGIQLDNGAILNMATGVYYIDKPPFSIQNGWLQATPPGGVTIIINGDYSISVGANSRLDIIAQSSGGQFAGIAMLSPRRNNPAVIQEFADGSYLSIQGAIYFASQTIQFDPGSQLNQYACTQIIAKQIHIGNNADVSANCSGTGVAPIPILEVYLSL
jgi:hypothetical protein